MAGANTKQLADYGIQAQIMKGTDGYQNVLMTGYYSPVIHARHTQQGKYNQPIYALPANKRFSRASNLCRVPCEVRDCWLTLIQ